VVDDADGLRRAFTGFFEQRGHTVVPSASLVPVDPSILFTIAGMVPFKPYFLGEERAPWPRATSVQKCLRTVDIDIVGTTLRHCTFFEMLGNFSFGDYFKDVAIPTAWELLTEQLGLDGERLWVTVHESDDEAAALWVDGVGVPPERVQKMGDDNFWKMGESGPCGPCSEIYIDLGPEHGAEGGPASGGQERFVELYNLVFMQFDRRPDGGLDPLPRPSIDTGAGLERLLPILEGVGSMFETSLWEPVLAAAQAVTGARYGRDDRTDVSLRILADHGRAMTVAVADGVLPANEGRGYVLRRLVRRAVRHAHQLGVDERPVTGPLVDAVVASLGGAYPDLVARAGEVAEILAREEHAFRRTLAAGSAILAEELAGGGDLVSGAVAFRLHDTHGFPVELTVEMAAEAGARVDLAGFEREMAAQRERARADAARRRAAGDERAYRDVLERAGGTAFIGYDRAQAPARVVAVLVGDEPGRAEIVLDQTPFYAEGGGQVGDRGVITTETGRAEVVDTQQVLPGLIVHRARVVGELHPGQDALAAIDLVWREGARRHHTGTHLLHAALRAVLGDHVHQQGSLVAPDRLRFDFSHPEPLRGEELDEVLAMANADVLTDAAVEVTETSREEATRLGALAFFGEKYGERVRVVRAGAHSVELCGGTHVDRLGMIGPLTVVSEGSIGAGTRRIEAVAGPGALARMAEHRKVLAEAASLLRVEPDRVIEALERLVERERQEAKELARLRQAALAAEAAELAASAVDGVVTARRDGLTAEQLRELAVQARQRRSLELVVLGGSPDGQKVALVAASDGRVHAGELVRTLAASVGGGGGGSAEVAVAGGRDVAGITAALAQVETLVGRAADRS
jgi:alanyl-tRNA synthetase